MKTPRDILLGRHQAVVGKLDDVRRSVVMGLNNQATKEQSRPVSLVPWLLGCSSRLWAELVLPCRQIWTGLAAAWVVLLVINLAQREPATTGYAGATPVMMSLRDQQRLLNELFADRSLPAEADRPKVLTPRPHTERAETAAV